MEDLGKKIGKYFRKSVHTISELLDHVQMNSTKRDKIDIDGDPIKLGSDRYKTFKFKGLCCVKCGIEGRYFAKERTPSKIISWHMNLYAVDKNGNEVLMTKDHIVPVSKGGPDHIDNYQPMCSICNSEKGSQENSEFIKSPELVCSN